MIDDDIEEDGGATHGTKHLAALALFDSSWFVAVLANRRKRITCFIAGGNFPYLYSGRTWQDLVIKPPKVLQPAPQMALF